MGSVSNKNMKLKTIHNHIKQGNWESMTVEIKEMGAVQFFMEYTRFLQLEHPFDYGRRYGLYTVATIKYLQTVTKWHHGV